MNQAMLKDESFKFVILMGILSY